MKGSQKITRIYTRGQIYYFQYTNYEGKRCQKSTGEKSKEKALEYANRYIGNSNFLIESSLIEYVSLFCDINTNPKRKRAKLDGGAYSKSYGKLQTRYAKLIYDELKNIPVLSNKNLSDITKYDLIQFKEMIVLKHGRRRKSQLIFTEIKRFLSFAYKEGMINNNISDGISNIKYKEKKRMSISPLVISYLIAHKKIFPSIEFWAFFTILATTGMRRGEVLGITPSRINNGILTIDRQFDKEEFIPPKSGIIRIIPLSKLTLEALSYVKTSGKDTRLFNKKDGWITSGFRQIKGFALARFPNEEEALSMLCPHVLRHSCNTNLIAEGMSRMLIAEYLAWEHQDILDIQARYTHLVARNLISVAAKIDELYTYKSNEIDFKTKTV